MRVGAPLLLILGLMSAAGGSARAQSRIDGILFDSLRTQRPIASAEVILLGTGRRTTTDRRGAFSFGDLAAGSHRIAYWAPWLDSVALPPVERALEIGTGERRKVVSLATPSIDTYKTARCGQPFSGDFGILLGEVRSAAGEPISRMEVSARWTEISLGPGRFSREQRVVLDTTSESGAYVLCGVPGGSELTLRAGDESQGTAELILALTDDPVVRRDLVSSTAGELTRLHGRVLNVDGSALAGATLALVGDSARAMTAGEDGRFSDGRFARRSSQLVVRALGYRPVTLDVTPLGEVADLGDVRLTRAPRELAIVSIEGRLLTPEEIGFERRKAQGYGYFLDAEYLKRLPRPSATALTMIPRTKVICPNAGPCAFFFTDFKFLPSGLCSPRLFVDGRQIPADAHETDFWIQRAVRIEAYRAALSPAEFIDFNGCGALVIWTR